MGGYGSGLYGSGAAISKTAIEHCRNIDIRRWQREDLLKSGFSFSWHWWNDKEKITASLGVKIQENHIVLSYFANDEIRTAIGLDETKTNYGSRKWFLCPACGKRVAILYMKGEYYKCRACHNLNYRSSQLSGDVGYYHYQLRKICMQLEAEYNPMAFYPPDKPKGMHWATYERLAKRYIHLKNKGDQLWLVGAARMLNR